MLRSYCVAVVLGVTFLCSAQEQPTSISQVNKVFADVRAAIHDWTRARKTLLIFEQQALRAPGAHAHREGPRLALQLRSGNAKVYQDLPECRDQDLLPQCESYELVVHAQHLGLSVTGKFHYKFVEFLLVDDFSGAETIVRAPPVFSPTGKHALVLLENDSELSFAVQIWRRAGPTFVREWSGSPYTDGNYTSYRFTRWNTECVIGLACETDYSLVSRTRVFELRRFSRGWQVVEGAGGNGK